MTSTQTVERPGRLTVTPRRNRAGAMLDTRKVTIARALDFLAGDGVTLAVETEHSVAADIVTIVGTWTVEMDHWDVVDGNALADLEVVGNSGSSYELTWLDR